jgi:hypothetical protein
MHMQHRKEPVSITPQRRHGPADAVKVIYVPPPASARYGISFANSPYTTVARMKLEPGAYWIIGTVEVTNDSYAGPAEAGCQLSGGEIVGDDTIATASLMPPNQGAWPQSIALQTAVTFAQPTTVEMQCWSGSPVQKAVLKAYRPKLTAIQASNLAVQVN